METNSGAVCLAQVTRLLLGLLYEPDFKMAFARALLGVYGAMVAKQGAEGMHMGSMLDQLVVQLFLSEVSLLSACVWAWGDN